MAAIPAQIKKNLNVLMVGSEGCGKTAFVHRFSTGEFLRESPSTQPKFHRVKLDLQLGSGAKHVLHLNLYESNNVDTDICRARYDATLLFYDVNGDSDSMLSALTQLLGSDYDCGSIILCGNKVDKNFRKTCPLDKIIAGLKADGMIHEYYQVSAKSCYNFDKPFLSLARLCCGNGVKFLME